VNLGRVVMKPDFSVLKIPQIIKVSIF